MTCLAYCNVRCHLHLRQRNFFHIKLTNKILPATHVTLKKVEKGAEVF